MGLGVVPKMMAGRCSASTRKGRYRSEIEVRGGENGGVQTRGEVSFDVASNRVGTWAATSRSKAYAYSDATGRKRRTRGGRPCTWLHASQARGVTRRF